MSAPDLLRSLLFACVPSLLPISSAIAQAVSAPAQSPPARHLTLKAALDLATRQNLDLAAVRLQRAVSTAGVTIAGQRPNPSGSFSASRDTPHESVAVGNPFEIA